MKQIFAIFLIIFSQQSCSALMNAPRVRSQNKVTKQRSLVLKPLKMSDQNMDDDSATKNDDNDEVPIIDPSTVKISDHSDLSNRFLYKVNALMGNYDPAATDTDNDSTDGNILNAIMTFPTTYAFNIVGKTNGDDTAADAYIAKVKDIVVSNSGNKEIEFVVKPRGKNFTKVTVEAYVESSSMITNIYEQLADVEETVMRF